MVAATTSDTQQIAPAAGVRFTVASRPQRRFSNSQTVSNLAGSTSFAPIQLPATGFVRKLALLFTANITAGSAAAIVAGDGPWNLVAGITLTDATGQPVVQPISGYNLYLVNKYLPAGVENGNRPSVGASPQMGSEFAYAAAGTSGTATFRLDLDFEQDVNTGYGCLPNLDSNASLQLKIDVAPVGNAFTGTGLSAATLSVRVTQYYWAPVGSTVNGTPVQTNPVGFGDYVETRYETQTVTAAAENTVQVTNRGGLIKGLIVVSRAAGIRTAYSAGTNVGTILDNNPIDEGVPIEEHFDFLRRLYGYLGADLSTSYAPLTAGTLPGLDRGVLVHPFGFYSGGRDSWLSTRVGSLFQLRLTPGAGATGLEIVTQIAQVRNPESFYAPSALS